jgi:hypothetical protein
LHSQHSRLQNVDAVNLAGFCSTYRPGKSGEFNLFSQFLPSVGRQFLGVGETGYGPVRVKNYGSRNDRADYATAANFINTGEAL